MHVACIMYVYVTEPREQSTGAVCAGTLQAVARARLLGRYII
jgi:hypothetical protein